MKRITFDIEIEPKQYRRLKKRARVKDVDVKELIEAALFQQLGMLTAKTRRTLGRKLEVMLMKHPGKWVAMTRKHLIAVGDNPDDAMGQARALGYENPIMHRVSDGTPFFG